jgi:hypothetical protein
MDGVSILRPEWFNGLDANDKADRLLMNRYFIRQAQLLATPEGDRFSLAKILGVSPNMLCYTYSALPNRGFITPGIAVKIASKIGEDRMPLSLLRPDLFGNKK